jgi:HEAT repeat protein
MRPEEDFDALRELLANDPDPEVRRSAAESLGEVDGGEVAFRAGDALLEATLDADPAVAAAAIRALEDVHDVVPDPRFRARVAALAGHPDPRVRAAAASFLEWTEDDW